MGAETGVVHLRAKNRQGLWQTPETRRVREGSSSSSPLLQVSEGIGPCQHTDFGPLFEIINSDVLSCSPSPFVVLFIVALGNSYMDSGTNIQLEVGKALEGVRLEGVKFEPSPI